MNLIAELITSLQRSAEREEAIKACRTAQAKAYTAQKMAGVPTEERCKLPAIGSRTTLAVILDHTQTFERIAKSPKEASVSGRREMLARRVFALTGIRPGSDVSIEEMLEIIEDHRPKRGRRPVSDKPHEYMPQYRGHEFVGWHFAPIA